MRLGISGLLAEGARALGGGPSPAIDVATSARPTYAPIYGQAYLRAPASASLLWELYLNVPALRRAVSIYAALIGAPELTGATDAETVELQAWAARVEHGRIGSGLSPWLQDCIAQMLIYGYSVSEAQVTPGRSDVERLWSYGSPAFAFRSDADGSLEIVQNTTGGLAALDRERVALAVHDPLGSAPQGQSLLLTVPMVANTWLAALASHERTWKRSGTPRYHVHWKEPAGLNDPTGKITGQVRGTIETGWNQAMKASEVDGQIMDFVSAGGDISVLTIGHDGQAMDIQVSKRALVEEIVVATGIPPFLFGYSWSTTERMSDVQAGLLSSMVHCLRREVSGALRQHVDLRQRLAGRRGAWGLEWPSVSLQDAKDLAQAQLWGAQARQIEQRTERQLWVDGVIDQGAYAEAMTGTPEVARPMDEPPAAVPAPVTALAVGAEYPTLRGGHAHGRKAGADDPVSLYPTEEPQYEGLRAEVSRAWRAVRQSFARLRRDWFEACGLDDPAKATKQLTREQRQALDSAINRFLREFAGNDRTQQGFVSSDTEDGALQQALYLAHRVGVNRAAEFLETPQNPAFTAAIRERLLNDSFQRLTQDGQFRFELRLGEIRDEMIDGLQRGDSPLTVARALGEDLDGYEAGRLRTICRTEMGTAAEGAICETLQANGVERVEVIGDPNTDAACTEHIGQTYSIEDVDNLPLYHPSCFCSVVPVTEGEQ